MYTKLLPITFYLLKENQNIFHQVIVPFKACINQFWMCGYKMQTCKLHTVACACVCSYLSCVSTYGAVLWLTLCLWNYSRSSYAQLCVH